MDTVSLGRWQFGITTVYHYLFVPITISLSMIVAVVQTIWVRTGHEKYYRLTRFLGNLFLINFALGLVTGIVQEFQFGMNWSEYSRFVGDVFGAPLALEALLAFFLESTFLGIWIFGWDKLPKKIHLAAMYMVAIGTVLSAVFILAANSWMQNPVGTVFNNGRAELDGLAGFGEVLTNPVFLVTFPHVIFAAYMTGGALVAGISGWHLAKLRKLGDAAPVEDIDTHRFAVRLGAWILLVTSVGTIISGDAQSRVMTEVQPMKMAAAEALYEDYEEGEGAPFSIITVGTLDGTEEVWALTVPKLLSYLSTGRLEGAVEGVNGIQERYEQTYAGNELTEVEDYRPLMPVTYWSFRLMMGLGFAGMAVGLAVLWRLRGKGDPAGETRMEGTRWWGWAAATVLFMPLFANSFGWIFTEMGRQPWVVMGLMTTQSGVSPSVGAGTVALSMVVYTLLYGVLAVLMVGLSLRYGRAGAELVPEDASYDPKKRTDDDEYVFTY
mgnify:CR=1 FL=1